MIIALAHVMKDEGINYQQALHVTATDLDVRCVQQDAPQLSKALLEPKITEPEKHLTQGAENGNALARADENTQPVAAAPPAPA